MLTRTMVSAAVVLGLASAQALAGPTVRNQAAEIVGAGAVSDPLLAVEANRAGIVNRIVSDHAEALITHGGSKDAFRAALLALRADQLLAASLVDDIEEVMAIVDQATASGPSLQRFVAVTPIRPTSTAELPAAQAYVVRDGEVLSIVKAAQLQWNADTHLVGYFAPATSMGRTTVLTPQEKPTAKDGSGSGAGSWIGYTAGGNVASGSGSAVAAGKFNAADNTNASIFAGQSNSADGVSSLVIGGFDNHATAIDSLVGAGAGNRATGARSVVVGGGYNLASGQWSFVGGGGRQTADPGAAGTYVEDNVAAGDSSTIGGGQGNRTGPNPYSTVAGGRKNTASHFFATVAGGDANTASGYASTIGGGSGNNATADSASVGWGYHNMASDVLSFAAGIYANANANRCVVFSLWSEPPPGMSCFNSSVFRIAADHGFSIDYYSRRSDGGGTRWVQISDLVANVTIATWTGAYLSDAGVWVSGSSSKASKTDFAAVDTRHVLEQVTHLPITTWRYKQGEGEVRHMGPMAEDFDAAFGIGYGPQTIADLDARGVALAAIQGLNQKLDQKLKEKDATTQRLLNKAQQLSREKDAKLARLERELTLIKKKLGLE